MTINSVNKFQLTIDAPAPVVTGSVYDKLCQSILYNLRGIIKGNTTAEGYVYTNTLYDITDQIKDPNNFSELPGCNIYYGKEVCKNNQAGFLQNAGLNRQILEQQFDLTLGIWGQAEDRRSFADSIKADIQACFGSNFQLLGADGKATALNILYSSGQSFFLKSTKPNVATTLDFTVHYRLQRSDPSEVV
jgi:hypothetical protein